MSEAVDPDAEALDFAGLTALLARSSEQARDHDTALRNALLRGHGSILSDRERSLLSNMIHVLVADMGSAFRRALSARQAEGDRAADALAGSLEDKWTETLQTKLAKIGAVGDLELIAAMGHRVSEHLLDIGVKPKREEKLIITPGSPVADPFEAANLQSDIWLAKAMSDYLVEKSRRFDGYGNPRLPLYELPPALAERLFWACAAAWREEILPDWRADEADLDDAVENMVSRALETTRADTRRTDKLVKVADALVDGGQLHAALLPSIIEGGEVGVFEAVLARLLDLPLPFVRALTFEPGGARLAVAARAAGLSARDFRTVDQAVGRVRHAARRGEPTPQDVFRRCTSKDAERMVRHWRRRPEYLDALRRYGGTEAESPVSEV